MYVHMFTALFTTVDRVGGGVPHKLQYLHNVYRLWFTRQYQRLCKVTCAGCEPSFAEVPYQFTVHCALEVQVRTVLLQLPCNLAWHQAQLASPDCYPKCHVCTAFICCISSHSQGSPGLVLHGQTTCLPVVDKQVRQLELASQHRPLHCTSLKGPCCIRSLLHNLALLNVSVFSLGFTYASPKGAPQRPGQLIYCDALHHDKHEE